MGSQANRCKNTSWIVRLGLSSLTLGFPLLVLASSKVSGIGAPQADLSPTWEGAVRQQIADAEYEVTWQGAAPMGTPGTLGSLGPSEAGWQAPNRAHGIRTHFTGSGIRVVPRAEETPAWEWTLAFAAWGRAGSVEDETLEPAEPRVDGGRIEFDRGGVVEWYVNDRRGLEQGFTIAAPPRDLMEHEKDAWRMDRPSPVDGARFRPDRTSGSRSERDGNGDTSSGGSIAAERSAAGGLGSVSRVRIDLALSGTLDPVISEDGQAIDFVTPSGAKVIHYAALEVRDAAGKELRAWMEGLSGPGTSRGIRILFEDGGAVYPVTVDPLATSPAWTVESDQASAEMGFSVAAAGDVNADGYSDVIVGAPLYDNGESNEGRALVYLGSASGLSTTPAWTAESNQADADFGWAVATAGDVNGDGYSDVLVGAIYYDNGQANEGRAFLYRGSSSGLATTPLWAAEGNQAGAWFGDAVGTAGDVNGDGYSDVIIGAYGYANGENEEGRAFTYLGSPAGLASTPAWTAESNQAGADFGISVSTAGDVNGDGYADVIVGSRYFTNGQTQEGRAFAYLGSAAGLAASPAWFTESNQASASFGWSVATAGDVNGDGYSDVVVGAYQYTNGETAEGRAYLFKGSAGGLSSAASWTVESNQAVTATGFSVATAGDVNGDGYADVIVSTKGWSNGEAVEGQVATYLGSAAGLETSPSWTVESNSANANFGWSVATAGDVNGDGYSDVIVGAPFYNNGQTSEGRAFVYLGSASGLAASAGWTAQGIPVNASAHLGAAVATAGDVNGDGYADVIVGAPLYDGGLTDEGRASLYLGSAAGLALTPAWSVEANLPGAQLGASVGGAGDINGDGYDDVIVGAPALSNGQSSEGRAYLYLGSLSGLATTPAWTAESNQTNAAFGAAVATGGDINGDGYADVLVGAPHYSSGQSLEGLVFIYSGSATGLPTTWSTYREQNQAGAAFGSAVGTAGDVDGDGYSDVVIGAPLYDNGQTNEGRAYLYKGSPLGLGTTPVWTTEIDQADADYGRSVGTAGDVNGDGFSDVIVGAPLYDNSLTDRGIAYVYLGSSLGLAMTPSWTVEGQGPSARFGVSVGSAGDVNGDGFADIIVGSDGVTNPHFAEGRAYAYHGSAAGLSTIAAWTAEGNQSNAQFGLAVGTAGDVNGDGYADVIVGAPFYDDVQTDWGRASLYYGNGGPGLTLRPYQRRESDFGPIAQLDMTNDPDRFRLGLLGRSSFGRGRVKLEWEVKSLGSLLNGSQTHVAVSWSDIGTLGSTLLLEPVTDPVVEGGAPLHWRVRTRDAPTTSPFQQRGRWLTAPWAGQNETKLRMAFANAGRVPDGSQGIPLRLTKVAGGQIKLDWDASCLAGDTDYEVYEGTFGNFASHAPLLCSTSGALTATVTPSAGKRYYLIVPRNPWSEGSYGTTNTGAERPLGVAACLPQHFGGCQDLCVGGRSPGAVCSTNQDCPGSCGGPHPGGSCLNSMDCLGVCSTDSQIPCANNMDPRCRFCLNNHSIQCTSNAQCMSVGGMCGSSGNCTGIGSCNSPIPGRCEAP